MGVSLAVLSAASASAQSVQVERGEYLATIMDCTGCHTPGALRGEPDMSRYLAGSDVGFRIPPGTSYPPNLTPDKETGLGAWSEAQIIKAVRQGVRPDGRILKPVMPYHSYGKLTDADASALVVYLKSLKPVKHKILALAGPSEKPSAPYLALTKPE